MKHIFCLFSLSILWTNGIFFGTRRSLENLLMGNNLIKLRVFLKSFPVVFSERKLFLNGGIGFWRCSKWKNKKFRKNRKITKNCLFLLCRRWSIILPQIACHKSINPFHSGLKSNILFFIFIFSMKMLHKKIFCMRRKDKLAKWKKKFVSSWFEFIVKKPHVATSYPAASNSLSTKIHRKTH